jgi:hypothetical protein
LSLEFDEAEDWNTLEAGKNYKIIGYKFRFTPLGYYPIVLNIIPIDT